MVFVARFELATSRSQNERSTELSYTKIGAPCRNRTSVGGLQNRCINRYTKRAWKRRQDSNLRGLLTPLCFQDRSLEPLEYASKKEMERITSLELVTSAWKAEIFPIKLYPHYGASKGTRTLTVFLPRDFKSRASANSAMLAWRTRWYSNLRTLSHRQFSRLLL